MRGFFGIGIYQPQKSPNVSGLLRTAHAFGADFVFTIGKRYKRDKQDTSDVSKHIPLDRDFWHDNIQDAIKYKKRSDSASKELLERDISELQSNITELELEIKEKQKILSQLKESLK